MKERRRMNPKVRKKQIVDTAVHLFYTVGYDGTSLRDLAEHVGINKATFYHYFKSKEEILYHILEEVGRDLIEGLRVASESESDPVRRIEAMIRWQIFYMKENLERIKVLIEEQKSLRSELAARTKVAQNKILKYYEDALQEAINAGKVRNFRLATAAFSILGQINWLYHWYKPTGVLPITELGEEVVAILMHGLTIPEKG